MRERCDVCNLRFQRADGNYFFGAVFFGLLIGEGLFVITFLITLVAMWPNVPWKLIQWAFPLGVLVLAPLLIPFSKLVFLSVDVLVRPVMAGEVA